MRYFSSCGSKNDSGLTGAGAASDEEAESVEELSDSAGSLEDEEVEEDEAAEDEKDAEEDDGDEVDDEEEEEEDEEEDEDEDDEDEDDEDDEAAGEDGALKNSVMRPWTLLALLFLSFSIPRSTRSIVKFFSTTRNCFSPSSSIGDHLISRSAAGSTSGCLKSSRAPSKLNDSGTWYFCELRFLRMFSIDPCVRMSLRAVFEPIPRMVSV